MIKKNKIKEYIEFNNKNIKCNSCNAYTTSIFKILERYKKEYKMDDVDLICLLHYERIIKILPKKLSTKKNYLTAILVAIRHYEGDIMKEIYKKYLDYTHNVKIDYDKFKKEKKTLVSWNDLNAVRENLEQIIKDRKIRNSKELTNRNKRILQQYVIISLYLLQAPRRSEYADVKIINENKYFKMSSEKRKKNNWLVVKSRNTKYFVFTKKAEIVVHLSSSLNSIINLWLKHNSGEWLLYDYRNNKMSSNNIVKALQRIFKPLGKNVSVNMIRHIFKTEHIKI
jgi:hypothetical protein|tara:strand:+ start:709 stop:1557 length:849 start_codon:yes stop_codon:yes gene_type:complete